MARLRRWSAVGFTRERSQAERAVTIQGETGFGALGQVRMLAAAVVLPFVVLLPVTAPARKVSPNGLGRCESVARRGGGRSGGPPEGRPAHVHRLSCARVVGSG